MDERPIEPIYQARTKEEFSKLEEEINKFLENYVISNQGQFCVSGGELEVDKAVNIFPDKYGRIEGVSSKTVPQLKGVLVGSTPEHILLDIEGTTYFIKYNP